MDKFYVYLYTRSYDSQHGEAGSPYYIGKGSGRRAWSNNRLAKPPQDPTHIHVISKDMNEPDALQLEMLLICQYGRIDRGDGCLWNRSDGGEFTPSFRGITSPMKGKHHSPETRAKLSAAHMGRKRGPNPPEWNAKISASQIGKVYSPETCAKISEAKKGQNTGKRPPEWCAAVSRGKMGGKRHDMDSGSALQLKSAFTRTGKKRGPYNKAILTAA